MTKAQYKMKLNELINIYLTDIFELSEKILNSGCVNLEAYEDNYKLPKMCLMAIFKSLGNQNLFDKETKKEIENISCFI